MAVDKNYLDTLGYTYTNITSGYVGLNYETLIGASEEFVGEVISALEPVITKENLIDLIIGMDANEIPTGKTLVNIQEISKAELPDLVVIDSDSKAFRVEKSIKDIGVYETDYICYAYVYGNEIQKKSKNGAAKAQLLADKMNEYINRGVIKTADLKDIATSFLKIATIDDIDIRLFKTFPIKDTGNLYLYDRHGIKKEQMFKQGSLFNEKTYCEETVTNTTFNDGVPVRIMKTITGMYGTKEVITEIPAYDNGVLVKSKITYSQKLSEGFQPTCYVHKTFQDGKLVKTTINDSKYGKKVFLFTDKGFHMEENDNAVDFTGDVSLPADMDAMEALRHLLLLEGGIMQLKNRLPEYKLDYSKVLNAIYTEKTNFAIAAIKENRAIIYVADRGNTTIYDADFKKAVYFPVDVIKKFMPSYKNYPNVIVEQRIKEGNDPQAIRRLYELGTRVDDEETIYGFKRIVKALAKNPATPADILADIVKRVYEDKFETDVLRFVAENPTTNEETLQNMINHRPSTLVRTCIEMHPNRPKVIKKEVTKEDAMKAEKAIFGS